MKQNFNYISKIILLTFFMLLSSTILQLIGINIIPQGTHLIVFNIFTIFISLKFLNFASDLDDAVQMEDENKLKTSFKELAGGLKFYIISLITIFIFAFFIVAISATLYHFSEYYYDSY